MVAGSSHSTSMCPPHSPTRTTKNSTLKFAGAFHCPNTSKIRFWAFSYSMAEPCGRSNQLITYFIGLLPFYLEIVCPAVAWTSYRNKHSDDRHERTDCRRCSLFLTDWSC